MPRNVIAVIIGIIVGMALYIGIQIFGLFNVQKQESMAVLLCIVAPLLRSFCGCWIAALLGSSRPMLLAMIVGIICLAGGIPMALKFFMHSNFIPQPETYPELKTGFLTIGTTIVIVLKRHR